MERPTTPEIARGTLLVVFFVFLICGFGAADAASGSGQEEMAPRRTPSKQELEERRARLRNMSPEQRKRLEENLRKLRGLPQEKVEELRRNHQALQDLRKKLLEEMPPEERARVEALPPTEFNREMSRRISQARSREERRFLQKLPEDVRARVRNLRPKERRAEIQRIQKEERRKADRTWLEERIERGDVSDRRAARIRNARPAEQDRQISRLRREMMDRRDRTFLDRMVKKERITPGERARTMKLDGFDRRSAIARIRVRDFLADPPAAFLQLSEERQLRLRRLPAHRFFEGFRRAVRESRSKDTRDRRTARGVEFLRRGRIVEPDRSTGRRPLHGACRRRDLRLAVDRTYRPDLQQPAGDRHGNVPRPRPRRRDSSRDVPARSVSFR